MSRDMRELGAFFPKGASQRLRSSTEVKVGKERHGAVNIGRTSIRVSFASSRKLSGSVLKASRACYRTLPVSAGETSWNAREPTLPGTALTSWAGPTCLIYTGSLSISSGSSSCSTAATCPQILLHDLPPFPASRSCFLG